MDIDGISRRGMERCRLFASVGSFRKMTVCKLSADEDNLYGIKGDGTCAQQADFRLIKSRVLNSISSYVSFRKIFSSAGSRLQPVDSDAIGLQSVLYLLSCFFPSNILFYSNVFLRSRRR